MVGDFYDFRELLERERTALEERNVIGEVFDYIASRRRIVIPKELVDFMKLVVNQSLDFRQKEWFEYAQRPPWRRARFYPENLVQRRVASVLSLVMEDTPSYRMPDGKEILSVTSVLENIVKRWCGIFPIC